MATRAYLHYSGMLVLVLRKIVYFIKFSFRVGLLEPVEGLSKTEDSVPCIIPLNRATVVIGRGPQLPDHGIPLLSSIAFEQRSKTVVSRSVNASWLTFKFGAHAAVCRSCFQKQSPTLTQ